jgi:hypothetical protein
MSSFVTPCACNSGQLLLPSQPRAQAKMFCADVLILERVGFLECRFDNSHKIGAHVEFCSTLRVRQTRNSGGKFLCERLKIDAELFAEWAEQTPSFC